MHRCRVVIIEGMASALVDVELCPCMMRESLPDRPLLLGWDVIVSVSEVKENWASDLSRQVQGVGNRRAVVRDAHHRVGYGGNHVCDTTTEAEAERSEERRVGK